MPLSNQEKIQKISECIDYMKHAHQCFDDKCPLDFCSKTKRAITHPRICTIRRTDMCKNCTQTMVVCAFHARRCTQDTCKMPFCSQIKFKYKQCRLNRRRRTAPYYRIRPTTSNISSRKTSLLQTVLEATLVACKPGQKIDTLL